MSAGTFQAGSIVGSIELNYSKAVTALQAVQEQTQATMAKMSAYAQKYQAEINAAAMGMAALGAAVVAAGTMMVKAAAEDEAGIAKLGAAIKTAGNKASVQNLSDFADQLQRVTLFTDEATVSAMTWLASTGKTEESIKKIIPVAQDLATLMGGDVTQATRMLIRVLGGMPTALRRFGIMLDPAIVKSRDMGKILAEVEKRVGGMAEAAGKAGMGPMVILRNAVDEVGESIGKVLLPAIQRASTSLTGLVGKLADVKGGITPLTANLVTAAVAVGTYATAWSSFVLIAPRVILLLKGISVALFTPTGVIAGIIATTAAVWAGVTAWNAYRDAAAQAAAVKNLPADLMPGAQGPAAAAKVRLDRAKAKYDALAKELRRRQPPEVSKYGTTDPEYQILAQDLTRLRMEMVAAATAYDEMLQFRTKLNKNVTDTVTPGATPKAKAAKAGKEPPTAVELSQEFGDRLRAEIALGKKTEQDYYAWREQTVAKFRASQKTAELVYAATLLEEKIAAERAIQQELDDAQKSYWTEAEALQGQAYKDQLDDAIALDEKLLEMAKKRAEAQADIDKELADARMEYWKQSEELIADGERKIMEDILAAEEAAAEKTKKALEKTMEPFRQFAEDMKQSFEGFFEGLLSGTARFGDIFKSILADINRMLAKIISEFVFEQTVGKLFEMIPGYASGGIVSRPTLALVGESGPEAIVPLTGRNQEAGLGTTSINLTVQALDARGVSDLLMRDGGSAVAAAVGRAVAHNTPGMRRR